MPRLARVVASGVPHHVTQRGNNRQDVFFVEGDRVVYLETLREQSIRFGLTIHGYCLMTNHVHLVVTPDDEQSLAKAVGRTHFIHAQYINRLHGRSGHVWQGRFHSCILDEAHFWTALCYVERNPVRTGLVRQAWKYRWSSAAAHVTGKDVHGFLDMSEWRRKKERDDWQAQLVVREAEEDISRIRSTTHTGRPLAGDTLISKLETRLGRRLRALPVGRPRRRSNKAKTRVKGNK